MLAGHGVASVIPALGRSRKEDCEFKASLGYMWRPSQREKNKIKTLFKARGGDACLKSPLSCFTQILCHSTKR
jgi:hypothetical protein